MDPVRAWGRYPSQPAVSSRYTCNPSRWFFPILGQFFLLQVCCSGTELIGILWRLLNSFWCSVYLCTPSCKPLLPPETQLAPKLRETFGFSLPQGLDTSQTWSWDNAGFISSHSFAACCWLFWKPCFPVSRAHFLISRGKVNFLCYSVLAKSRILHCGFQPLCTLGSILTLWATTELSML